MLEIYNETVLDLLSDDATPKGLDIRQNPAGGVHVPDLNVVSVACLDDVIKVMAHGYSNRAVGSHNVNEHSSRSHLVLSVDVRSPAVSPRTHAYLLGWCYCTENACHVCFSLVLSPVSTRPCCCARMSPVHRS